jgi:hypothetical protein
MLDVSRSAFLTRSNEGTTMQPMNAVDRATPLTENDFMSRRQPFMLEARVKRSAASHVHRAALDALQQRAAEIRRQDPSWVCTPEFSPESGTYRLHCRRMGRKRAVELVGTLAGGIIMGTLASALAGR